MGILIWDFPPRPSVGKSRFHGGFSLLFPWKGKGGNSKSIPLAGPGVWEDPGIWGDSQENRADPSIPKNPRKAERIHPPPPVNPRESEQRKSRESSTCVISFLRIWWKLSWVRFRICFPLSFAFLVISKSEISGKRGNGNPVSSPRIPGKQSWSLHSQCESQGSREDSFTSPSESWEIRAAKILEIPAVPDPEG